MYLVINFESKLCDSKSECLNQLAEYLNEVRYNFIVCDIEKEWYNDENIAYYRASLRLNASILIKEVI